MLEVMEHHIKNIVWSEKNDFRDGILNLEKNSLQKEIHKKLKGEYEIELELVYPDESKRIIHVTDVIRPCYKENGAAYPGWEEKENSCGEGIRHQTSDLCITQSFKYPGIQEGIIDMDTSGSDYSIFSKKMHLVMVLTLLDTQISKQEIAQDLIQMMINTSVYIGKLLSNEKGSAKTKVFQQQASKADLPKVGYAYFIQAQGLLRNVHLFGKDCTKMKPVFVPTEQVLDGAIVSGNYIIACQKNPTYIHQENPVVQELYEKKGKEIEFEGVIFATESSSLDEKRENAKMIAEIAKEHHYDGMIITQEGGGHADVDLMETCEACELEGIKTVIIANELAGPLGNLPSLVAFSDKADAIVSTGNNDEAIQLQKVNEVIGTPPILNNDLKAGDELNITLGKMYTATCQLGINKMKTQLY